MAQTDTQYSEIKAQVKYNIGRDSTEVDAQMNLWARFAMREITRWRDSWFERAEATVPTVVDQQTYDLPVDFKGDPKLYILKADKYVEIRGPIGLPEALRRFSPQDEGEPESWSFFTDTDGTDQFKVWPPKPDAVYSIKVDYTRYLTDLEDDADVNALTLNYPDLLIAKMTKWGFRYLQEHADAKEWDAESEKIMRDLHAQWVARVMGSDHSLTPRADVLGHGRMIRSTGAYIVIK